MLSRLGLRKPGNLSGAHIHLDRRRDELALARSFPSRHYGSISTADFFGLCPSVRTGRPAREDIQFRDSANGDLVLQIRTTLPSGSPECESRVAHFLLPSQ